MAATKTTTFFSENPVLLNGPAIGQGQMVLVKQYNLKPEPKLNRKEFKIN